MVIDPVLKLQITTNSPEETRRLGEKIGKRIQTAMVLALCGDLGSGKTAFVQGLACGLDVPDGYYITSPSYTLINEFPGRYTLFHVDLYRIETPVDIEDIGLDEILYDKQVVAVEWADRLGQDLPAEHLNMKFEISSAAGRRIYLTAYGLEPAKLLKKLEKM